MIRNLAKPDYEYALPALQLSEEAFRPHIPMGEAWKALFSLFAEDGRVVAGAVTSNNRRIILASDDFAGTRPEILFGIDTKGLRVDEKVTGEIRVRSNLGEAILSVEAVVVEAPDEDFDPEIRALEDFEQLCRRNLREGFRLFTHPAFPHILNGKNVIYQPLYRALSRNPVSYQHMEEFLIASGKKEPILLSLDKQQKAVYQLDASQKDTLYIYKNNWGYLHAEVLVEGDFLEVARNEITTDDFIGDICGLEYVVHREHIGQGRVYGRIILKTVHQELIYEIEASAKEGTQIQPRTVRSRRIAWLMRDYLKLRLHELDYRTWQDSSAMTVGEMLEEDEHDAWAILYSAYLRYTQDNNAKAMEILWPLKEGAVALDTREKKALYLWLAKKTGLLPYEQRDLRPLLQQYLERRPSSYLLLYLLQQEDEGPIVPAQRLQELEQCFRAGCTSPFLYLDAWEMLQKEEALLRELSPFLTQVLCFGQRHGKMTSGLLHRAAALSAGQKTYSKAIFRVLSRGYQTHPEEEILEAICQMLVKGDPMRKECFPWYALAVERDIRMTRLFEYYMETYDRPAEEVIPADIRMYFATNDTLGESKKALLYASVVLHKEEAPTGYVNYAKNMRSFAYTSLQKGKINKNYAILYQHFFGNPETPEIAALLTKVLFVQRVTVTQKKIRQVIVCHNALKNETLYPCRDGVSYPQIYSEDACLLFEDDQHRRFATTLSCLREPMFATREIARACMQQGVEDPGLLLFLCKEKAFQMDVNSRSFDDYRMAERNPAFTDAYRQIVRRKLLEYALAHSEQTVTELLTPEKIGDYADADRAATAQVLIRDERYDEAFAVISEYGFEQIPLPLLTQLAEHMIEEKDGALDEELLFLCAHLFEHDVQNEEVLQYLQEYQEAPLSELGHLWEKVYGAGLDPLPIEERILRDAVQTRQLPEHMGEILADFMERDGDPEVTACFLTYLAGQYFLGGRRIDEAMIARMEDGLRSGLLIEDICKLAVLKYDAGRAQLSEEQYALAYRLLQEEEQKGYRFAFYKDLPPAMTEGIQIEDKLILEEQFTPDSRVILRYRLHEDGVTDAEWTNEPMPQIYPGIFHKEFPLFADDRLTYEVRVMTKGVVQSSEERTVTIPAPRTDYTRYALLNRMRETAVRGEMDALAEQERQYLRQQLLTEQFLTPERDREVGRRPEV